MRRLIRGLWVAGLLLIAGCSGLKIDIQVAQPTVSTPNHHVTTATYEGVIFNMDNTPSLINANWAGDPIEHYWTPYAADIVELEAGLIPYLRGAMPERDIHQGFWESLPHYKRQYLGVFQATDPYVWTNFFCADDFPDWQNTLVSVDDGGSCFFSVWYDATKKEFFDLQVNGVA